MKPGRSNHVVPGSWINANFDIWIGADEDNQAWELLLDARRVYDEYAAQTMEIARLLAYEELLIAEGSDWCWWYGPEHGSDNRPEFDQLYRDHLSNVYRALGLEPPERLSYPILKAQEGELHEPPSNPIDVTLDGEVTSAFEWMGAGHYQPDARSGAMHGGQLTAREMFYGSNGTELFVRLDSAGTGKVRHRIRERPRESASGDGPGRRNGGSAKRGPLPGHGRPGRAAHHDAAGGGLDRIS